MLIATIHVFRLSHYHFYLLHNISTSCYTTVDSTISLVVSLLSPLHVMPEKGRLYVATQISTYFLFS